jgi:hypothetical protein
MEYYIVAQIPGAEDAIKRAGEQGGWMAVVIVVVFFLTIGTLGMLVKILMDQSNVREKRMAAELETLNVFIRDKLMAVIVDCNSAFTALSKMLGARPCLMDEKDQLELLERERQHRREGNSHR